MRELNRETVHRNPWFSVVRRDYEGEAGDPHPYFMVSKPDSVLVVVRLEDGRVVLVDLPRPTFDGAPSLEFPQGGIEEGESPEAAAHREVLEETGLRLTGLRRVGSFAESSGFATTSCHVFVGDAAGQGDASPDVFERDLRLRTASWPELRESVRAGRVPDSATLAAMALIEVAGDGG
ncbi:NUDIX domain-containing protein [Streptomyces sp. NPDC091040]|uniref:NUDIX domain-containing protein n=1 Tax=Streptomyces sp. NPDC091040 TaxID=3365972 RepID=UPI00380E8629